MSGAKQQADKIRETIDEINSRVDLLLHLLRDGKIHFGIEVELEDQNGAFLDWESDALKGVKIKTPSIVAKQKL